MANKVNVIDCCVYLINHAIDKEKPVSNLTLQKMLYDIQARCLVKTENKMFPEDILSWRYGPVVAEAYFEYRINVNQPIEKKVKYPAVENRESPLSEENIEDINCIFELKKDKTAFQLVNETHQENPWKKSHLNQVITADSIEKYFKKYPEKVGL